MSITALRRMPWALQGRIATDCRGQPFVAPRLAAIYTPPVLALFTHVPDPPQTSATAQIWLRKAPLPARPDP